MPRTRSTSRRFPAALLDKLETTKILGVRAGDAHKFTGVWLVVVEGRLFVRSWNDKPTGWFRAFREHPLGAIQVDGREIAVRGIYTRSARLRNAVTEAYAAKYNTKASEKWVRGFAEPARLAATLELTPRSPRSASGRGTAGSARARRRA